VSTALAKAEKAERNGAELAPAAPSRGAVIVADALRQESEQRHLLGQYVAHHMVEGTDYGVIPGTKNRTLLKPGAEKLTQLFRTIPRYTVEDKVEDWQTGLFSYRFRCQIVTQADETVVAEGVGSCSTYESRYRWRNADRTCPNCGKPTIIKGKAEYGGGWLCFAKKGGCGAKFGDDDEAIVGQPTGRVQNPDLIDCVNTVLKMAKKRALVDAAIALARCSDVFTQDAEDFAADHPAPAPAAPAVNADMVDVYRGRIEEAATLAALGELWKAIPKQYAAELVTDKDRRKAELAAATAPKAAPVDDADLAADDLRARLEGVILEAGTDLAAVMRRHGPAVGWDARRNPTMPTLDQLTAEACEILLGLLQPAGAA